MSTFEEGLLAQGYSEYMKGYINIRPRSTEYYVRNPNNNREWLHTIHDQKGNLMLKEIYREPSENGRSNSK